jgi:hypothetical protein
VLRLPRGPRSLSSQHCDQAHATQQELFASGVLFVVLDVLMKRFAHSNPLCVISLNAPKSSGNSQGFVLIRVFFNKHVRSVFRTHCLLDAILPKAFRVTAAWPAPTLSGTASHLPNAKLPSAFKPILPTANYNSSSAKHDDLPVILRAPKQSPRSQRTSSGSGAALRNVSALRRRAA